MIEYNSPAPQPGRVVRFGCPWHGVVQGGSLTTTEGGVSHAWSTQPDAGDAWLFAKPGLASQTTPAGQQALGMEWRNQATVSGWWERQVYGQPLPGGSKSWVAAIDGVTYAVHANLAISLGMLSGNVVLRPLTIPGGTVVYKSVSVTVPNWRGSNASTVWDVVSISPDGCTVYIGLWGTVGGGSTITYSQASGLRGIAKLTNAGVDSYVPPGAWMKIALTSGPNAALSVYKTASEAVTFTVITDTNSHTGAQLGPCAGETWFTWEGTYSLYDWEIATLIGITWTAGGTQRDIHFVEHRATEDTGTQTDNGTCDPTAYSFSVVKDQLYEMIIRVAGTDVSKCVTAWNQTSTGTIDASGTSTTNSTTDNSASVTVNGNSIDTGTVFNSYADTGGITWTIQGDGGALTLGSVVRHTNNAWEIVLWPDTSSFLSSPTRYGIVNALSGAIETSSATFTSSTPLADLYGGSVIHATVDPYTEDLQTYASAICYV